MKLPIRYALTWPTRAESREPPLDLFACPPLTFAPPDLEAFPCLALAGAAAKTGGTACAVLNGANEAAVALFLAGKIGFLEISALVERALHTIPIVAQPTLADILAADEAARAEVRKIAGPERTP